MLGYYIVRDCPSIGSYIHILVHGLLHTGVVVVDVGVQYINEHHTTCAALSGVSIQRNARNARKKLRSKRNERTSLKNRKLYPIETELSCFQLNSSFKV